MTTTSEATVGELVRRSMDRLTPAERRVAHVLLAAYPIAGLETVAELGERAQVSGPTVMRFVQKLGFDGYPEFQRSLREEIQARISSPLTLYEHRPAGLEGSELLESSLRTFSRALDATFTAVPPSELAAVVDLLADTRRRVLMTGGRFSQVLAYYLFAHLHQLRSRSRLLDGTPASRMDALIDVGRRDVLVVFDYRRYQRDTVELAYRAARQGATLVLFTDPWLSPIAEVARHILASSVEAPSPFDSLVPGMALVEAVVAGLVTKMGGSGRARMERLEELRTGFAWGEPAPDGR